MSRPYLSIVTPSYNQAPYLLECLRSVAVQRGPEFEHIVFDGGSKDDSVTVLQEYSARARHTLRWISEQDRGQSHALNKGFRAAEGEIIGWLNADDRYREGCFEAIARTFAAHPEIDILYGDYTWINAQGATIQLRRETSFSRFVLMYHRVLYIPTTALFLRRRVFDSGNFIDESLDYAMDFEFLVRLSTLGCRFLHLPEVLADFRFHPSSKSSMFAQRQLAEQDKIMLRYSPILRACQQSWLSTPLTRILRASAAFRRYAEKAIRGYYFTQFRPAQVKFTA